MGTILLVTALTLIALLLFVVAIGSHEYGHLFAARRLGIHADAFNIGNGKVLLERTTKTGLIVRLRLIPLGGGVEVRGMMVKAVLKGDAPKEGSFAFAHPFKRIIVSISGVIVNLALAVLSGAVAYLLMFPPNNVADVIRAPAVGFWVALLLLGTAFTVIVMAPFNGFAGLSSPLSVPGNIAQLSENTQYPPLAIILMVFMALNLFMVALNIIPIPPLDGYMIMQGIIDLGRLGVSKLKGRAYLPMMNTRLQLWASAGGIAFFAVSVFLLSRDAIRLLGR